MLDDTQLIEVTFSCCNNKALHKIGDFKAGTVGEGFVCPVCMVTVKYIGHEFAALLNKEPGDALYKITLC